MILGIAKLYAPLHTALMPGQVQVQTPTGDELLFWVGGGAVEGD